MLHFLSHERSSRPYLKRKLSLVGSTLAARHFNSNGAKLSNIYEISKFFEGKKRKYPLYRVNRHTFFCFKFLQFSLHLPRKFCIFA